MMSEFLMLNRPEISDLYAVLYSSIHILVHDMNCDNILFDPESISYDRTYKKVKYKKNDILKVDAREAAKELYEYIAAECRYAEEETYRFIRSFSEIYNRTYKNDHDLCECLLFLKKYNSKNDNLKYMMCLFICVFFMEYILSFDLCAEMTEVRP